MELQKGQKIKISDLRASGPVSIRVMVRMNSGQADVTCFGVDAAGRLSDDRYFVFYNQAKTPEGEITMTGSGEETVFSVDLDRLPQQIQKLVVTVAADGSAMRDISSGRISLGADKGSADYSFAGAGFQEERALILCELYRKDNIWRYTVVANGFNGGLEALLNHFGGQAVQPQKPVPEAPSAPAPAPAPAPGPSAPKVNLSKISLKKSGESHRIDLSKNGGEIHVNLNWNAGRKKIFGGGRVDLDLACMYRLKDGHQGVVQALGNSFGSANSIPFILLDQDDRTGASVGGENMYFKRPELLDFAVVFAFIYEGVPNWRSTDAAVVLHQKGAPDIEIRIDNPDSRSRFCVLASLSGKDGGLEVKREDKFFAGHKEVDEHYHFGFRWVAGRK